MPIRATMTGSWYRTPEIAALIRRSPTGEVPLSQNKATEDAERRAIRDQLHPLGGEAGLYQVSNGEQRKSSYTAYLPNRFHGFSRTEKVRIRISEDFVTDMKESNPRFLTTFGADASPSFLLPKILTRLEYHGEKLARREASDAVRIAREEKAPRVFLPSASPGVVTIFFPREKKVYRDHRDYLDHMVKEMRKEYRAILEVEGVDLQIDAPDIAMAKVSATDWEMDFYEALPYHVDAINEATAGLSSSRIRVHYCFGNYRATHRFDADYSKILPEIMRLKAKTIVGEMANPRHEGDALKLGDYLKENSWPKGLTLAAGVIDVKTPMVETPETVALRLDRLARIDKIGPERLMAGTDCGFETFSGVNNQVTYKVGLRKLQAEAHGAELESQRLGF
jgi:5-methyltetrahydropteroyltriglutamate--homocysteine methyltransferase